MIVVVNKIFKLLSSDIEPYQLSLGISLGMMVGLSPLLSLQTLVAMVFLVVLRANLSAFITSLGLMSLIAYLLDPLLAWMGHSILTQANLEVLFTQMYNNGVWRLLNFNNTVAMGSLVISVLLFLPIFVLSNFLIKKYRTSIEKYWKESAFYKYIKHSKLLSRIGVISEKVI